MLQIHRAALVVLVATAPVILAQPQRGAGRFGGGFGGPGLMLLVQKAVQDELKLTEEQTKKITELIDKQRESFAELRKLDGDERRKKVEERSKETLKALNDILNSGQQKRMKQLSLQAQGLLAVGQSEVATALKIDDEQKKKIQGILEDSGKEMRGLFQGGDREEARKKMAELRKTTNEKITGILSDDQKKAWKELLGEPFQGELRPFGGRRPGGDGK
jgi:Spy/CpxP family protein refolding chaperone